MNPHLRLTASAIVNKSRGNSIRWPSDVEREKLSLPFKLAELLKYSKFVLLNYLMSSTVTEVIFHKTKGINADTHSHLDFCQNWNLPLNFKYSINCYAVGESY